MHLFPESGLDQSATTSVFLGVLVSWFFTETLGWVFAGLVVPGYLASLFVLDARSALVDVGEAALSYGAAKLVGEHLSRTGLTSRFFGRERFLLVLVTSVLVRLGTEALALPRAFPHASWAYSVGLVVVPLLANSCWKTGLFAGLFERGVPTLVVFVLLKYVLLRQTNLSLGGFYLATENVAASFLSSPKAYIVLLTGAFLAAAANVRWGWDYNGILVPALLGLTVEGPARLVVTFAEAVALVLLLSLLQRTTRVGRWNIEGPRRPVLIFGLDYALRFGAAWLAVYWAPLRGGADISGFGYLLPTLLAVKITRVGLVAPVLLPTASVSVAAYGLGTLLGFGAQTLDTREAQLVVTRQVGQAPADLALATLWASALARAVPPDRAHAADPQAWTLDLEQALARHRRGLEPADGRVEVQALRGGVLLRERFQDPEARRGAPALLVRDTGERLRDVLVVATPLSEPLSALAAGKLLVSSQTDAVLLSGVDDGSTHGNARALNAAIEVGLGLVRRQSSGLSDTFVGVLELTDATHAQVRGDLGKLRFKRSLQMVRALSAPAASLERASGSRFAGAFELSIPRDGLALVGGEPSAVDATPLSVALDELRCRPRVVTAEEALVFERLLLAPLLGHRARSSAGLLGAASATLSLAPPRRIALQDGEHGWLVSTGADQGALVLLARERQVSGTAVIVPNADTPALRRLGARLWDDLDADSLVLSGCGEHEPEYRAALATAAGMGGAAPRRVIEARAALPGQATTTWATWGPADGLAAEVNLALGALAIPGSRASLDPRSARLASDYLARGAALFALYVARADLHDSALHGTAGVLENWRGLPRLDATTSEVARSLASGLVSTTESAADVLSEVREAVEQGSVSARRRVEAAEARGAVRLAVQDSLTRPQIVMLARSEEQFLLAALPLARTAHAREPAVRQVAALSACGPVLAAGDACALGALR
jgi:hypothetical protein